MINHPETGIASPDAVYADHLENEIVRLMREIHELRAWKEDALKALAKCGLLHEALKDRPEYIGREVHEAIVDALANAEYDPEAGCTCDGGEQGDGLCYVPHASTCPVAIRQRSR